MAGFKTPHGLNVYLNENFFFYFAEEKCNVDETKRLSILKKAWRRIEYLFETPRCFSLYLLTFFLFTHTVFSFLNSFLCFFAVKLFGSIISRVNLPKPLYSLLCIVNCPFQLLSFNFYLPYIVLSVFAFITHQWPFLLSYIVAFIVFYVFDNILNPMIVITHMKKKYGVPFYGADFCAFIAYFNELKAYKVCTYSEFIDEYCYFVDYENI